MKVNLRETDITLFGAKMLLRLAKNRYQVGRLLEDEQNQDLLDLRDGGAILFDDITRILSEFREWEKDRNRDMSKLKEFVYELVEEYYYVDEYAHDVLEISEFRDVEKKI